ncbi:MAG: hypothetical protein HYW65_00035 [Candidatus Liptonbacteria bacterium]|nr:hypothetical protein [Candidatus Liptonbacteria bacterium]MBI3114800.1 hypothetical protein [Candidatus Harrisonbacteria bacterium]
MKKLTNWLMPAVSIVLPLLAQAAALPGQVNPTNPGAVTPSIAPTIASTGTGVFNIVCIVITWIFYVLIILAVVFVIMAAIKYVTASGDPEKIEKANHQIIYAAVAVVVGLLARGFPAIIGSIFGADTAFVC